MDRNRDRKLRRWWECEDSGTGAGGDGVGSRGMDAASGEVGVVGAEHELRISDEEVHAEEETDAEEVFAPMLELILAPRRFSRENGPREVDAGIPDVEPPGREKYDGLSENRDIKN